MPLKIAMIIMRQFRKGMIKEINSSARHLGMEPKDMLQVAHSVVKGSKKVLRKGSDIFNKKTRSWGRDDILSLTDDM
jgi:hypothetical protein